MLMELFVTTLYGLQNTSIRATAQFCLAEMLQPQNSQAGSQAVTVTCAGMAAGFTLEEILNGVVQPWLSASLLIKNVCLHGR